MRTILISIFLTVSSYATTLGISKLHLPIYFHSDMEEEIIICEVPFVTYFAAPEAKFGAMSKAYIPHHDKSWKDSAADTNLISIYGIALSYEQAEQGFDYHFTIDISKASKPDDMPFTIKQVVDHIKQCATLNFNGQPEAKLIFHLIEQQEKP